MQPTEEEFPKINRGNGVANDNIATLGDIMIALLRKTSGLEKKFDDANLESSKKEKRNYTLLWVSVVISGIAIVLTGFSVYLQKTMPVKSAQKSFLSSDQYNLYVACSLADGVVNHTDSAPLSKFDSNPYKENGDYISSLPLQTQELIRQNISYMDLSNEWVDIMKERPNTEGFNKISAASAMVFDNIKKYNERLKNVECKTGGKTNPLAI